MDKNSEDKIHNQFEQFAHCTSHVLTDPIRKIIAISEQSESECDDIHRIKQETENVLNVIKELRKYSFFVLKSTRYKEITIDKIIAESLDILDDKGVNAKNVTEYNFDSTRQIICDKTQLVEVFTELLNNAVKFSIPDSKITIGYTEDSDYHIFSFTSLGEEIDSAYLKNIFTLSMRGDNSDNVKGYGLGLASVAVVADNHKGKAWAESSADRNIFYISISKSLTVEE